MPAKAGIKKTGSRFRGDERLWALFDFQTAKLANAPLPVFFAAPGTPSSLFPFPHEGNGAHPISGLPEIGHV
jgi:hypothetical protein